MVPGTTLEQTEASSPTGRRSMLRTGARSRHACSSASVEGNALRPDHAQGRPGDDQHRIRARADPGTAEHSRCAGHFPDVARSRRGGGTGRAISVMLAGSDPELLEATAAKLVEQMKGVKGLVAPRIAADLQRPEIIITPRLDLAAQPGRHHGGAQPDDPHRHDRARSTRTRPSSRCPTGRCRSGCVCPKDSRATSRRSRTCRCRPAPAARCRCQRVAEITFGAGPTQIQRYNQTAPRLRRRRSGARRAARAR